MKRRARFFFILPVLYYDQYNYTNILLVVGLSETATNSLDAVGSAAQCSASCTPPSLRANQSSILYMGIVPKGYTRFCRFFFFSIQKSNTESAHPYCWLMGTGPGGDSSSVDSLATMNTYLLPSTCCTTSSVRRYGVLQSA